MRKHDQCKWITEIELQTAPARHLAASISPARADSSVSCKTSTRVAQVTGCLPLPVSHSWRTSVLICSASFKCLWAMNLTLNPVLSSRRKLPNLMYLVAISTGILITLPSVHVNLSSSCNVGSVPGLYVVMYVCFTIVFISQDIKALAAQTLPLIACRRLVIGKHEWKSTTSLLMRSKHACLTQVSRYVN